MKLKADVNLIGLKPELLVAMVAAETVYRAYAGELVITSCNDGKHMAESKHYIGAAFDCRTRDVTAELQVTIANAIRAALTKQFDVILESDHIHVEFDPK